MQAFWVRANSAGTVTFTNAMRSHGDGASNQMKAPKVSDQKIIRLQVANAQNYSDETVLYFDENAQNSFDKYDSPKMFNNVASKPELYTKVGAEDLVINGLSSIQKSPLVNLGFKTGQTNDFTLRATEIKNLDANIRLILKDNQENIETDITDGANYAFTSAEANTSSRFSLIFRTPSITTSLSSQSMIMEIVKNTNNQLVITSNSDEKGVISIYNSLGQRLKSVSTQGYITTINEKFEAGVYIVSLEKGGIKRTEKIILN